MTTIEALEIIFDFFPPKILEKVKEEGLFDLILEGRVKDGAEIYDFLNKDQAALQSADYSNLAKDLEAILKPGATLQIGCGQGDLLRRLARAGFFPLYGIDRSDHMIQASAERLKEFDEARLFHSKVEEFDFSSTPKLKNVIINNFWGLLNEKASEDLLKKIRDSLAEDGLIIIGKYYGRPGVEKILAMKALEERLNFVFSYPFFKDFEACGFRSELRRLDNGDYFILTRS